jgi:hypothetical protein
MFRPVTDCVLVVFIKLFENLHKAKQVLLRNLVVVLEAVIAFKHKLTHFFLVTVHKLLNIRYVLMHLEVILVSEIKERRVRQQVGYCLAQFLFVALFQMLSQSLLV